MVQAALTSVESLRYVIIKLPFNKVLQKDLVCFMLLLIYLNMKTNSAS